MTLIDLRLPLDILLPLCHNQSHSCGEKILMRVENGDIHSIKNNFINYVV